MLPGWKVFCTPGVIPGEPVLLTVGGLVLLTAAEPVLFKVGGLALLTAREPVSLATRAPVLLTVRGPVLITPDFCPAWILVPFKSSK